MTLQLIDGKTVVNLRPIYQHGDGDSLSRLFGSVRMFDRHFTVDCIQVIVQEDGPDQGATPTLERVIIELWNTLEIDNSPEPVEIGGRWYWVFMY